MPPITRTAWRDALRRSTLPPAARSVANALAAYWPTGTTLPLLWATKEVLADDTGYSVRHVKRALGVLRDEGWLVVAEKARQHRAPRYAPVIPGHDDVSEADPQGGRHVPPGPVDNPSQGGHHVPSDGIPGGTSTTARGDRMSPDPKTHTERTPLPPEASQQDDTTAGDIRRGGWPSHIHEANAVRALAALTADCRLPIDVDELLEHAYRVGAGNPWHGYERIKPACLQSLDGARDPGAVLRARLRSA